MRPFEVQEKAYLTEYYRSAIGLTIVGVSWLEQIDMANEGEPPNVITLDYHEQMPQLVCEAPPGHPLHGLGPIVLGISQDPEGNGPGFLFGLLPPQPEGSPR